MRRASELDLYKGNVLIDTENKQLVLTKRYNCNTWLALNSKQSLEMISCVDINKYRTRGDLK